MKRTKPSPPSKLASQQGFIPMLVCVFVFVVGLAYLVYLRVASAH